MAKKKYYAIKDGKGVKNKIVDTWNECEKLVLGYPAKYKSFKTKDEAMEYLGLKVIEEKIDVEPVKRIKKKKGKNQDMLRICLDKELYKSFKEKCEKMNISEDIIIKNMIMEWLD